MAQKQERISEGPQRWGHCRLTEVEFWTLFKHAAQLGITRSRFLRKCLREGMGQGPDPFKEDFETLHELAMQLGAIGRNFNQLVRRLNSNESVDDSELLRTVSQVRIKTEQASQTLRTLILHARDRQIRKEF